MRPALLTKSVVALGTALLVTLALGGCGGSTKAPVTTRGGSASAKHALAQAKRAMDSASSWHLSLATTSKPSGGNAVLKADGSGTHRPLAWKGSVEVILGGIQASVPIVSTGGKVYGKLPFTTSYAVIDPSQYDAPDPADFMSTTHGLSALLTQIRGPHGSGQQRDGSQVVDVYAGTLSGSAVKAIIPSADAGSSYATTVSINSRHQVTGVRVTGSFFSGSGAVTYDMSVDDYGQDVKITAP